jgi:hypothetical protein
MWHPCLTHIDLSAPPYNLQKELSKKVKRLDDLQAELNAAVAGREVERGRADTEAAACEQLRGQLAALGTKDGELQTLAADLAAAASARAALEAKVCCAQRMRGAHKLAGSSFLSLTFV